MIASVKNKEQSFDVQRKYSAFAKCIFTLIAKDIKIEYRTKLSLNSVLLFAITSTFAITFAVGSYGTMHDIASTMIWIILYFAVMSEFNRSFLRENEMQTSDFLRLSAFPSAIYLSKLVLNTILLLSIEIIVVPIFVLLTDCQIKSLGYFLVILLFGSIALCAIATISSAMMMHSQAKGALFSVICFPISIPVLIISMHGTNLAFQGLHTNDVTNDILLVACYAGILITFSLMMFNYIWES